jgi:membrane-associated phospholipid phosphatase
MTGGRNNSGPLVAVAVAYLGVASGVMIWRGISVSPDYLLLLLIPIALLSGRFFRFLGDWVPFIALFLGWEAMRGIAGSSGIQPHVGDVASIDRWLFAGHLPTQVFQDTIGRLGLSRAADYVATVVYFGHFVIPVAVGITLWLVDRTQFLRFTTALLALAFGAFVIYLLVPTAPPWYAQDHGVIDGVRHVMGSTLPSAVSPYYQSLNPNPVAALPSLHAAFPFLGFLALRKNFPRGSLLALAWAVMVWFSVIYLGEHYLVDVAGGILAAWATWAVMTHVVVPRVAVLRDARPSAATTLREEWASAA